VRVGVNRKGEGDVDEEGVALHRSARVVEAGDGGGGREGVGEEDEGAWLWGEKGGLVW
jgi:hypothetical protein